MSHSITSVTISITIDRHHYKEYKAVLVFLCKVMITELSHHCTATHILVDRPRESFPCHENNQ